MIDEKTYNDLLRAVKFLIIISFDENKGVTIEEIDKHIDYTVLSKKIDIDDDTRAKIVRDIECQFNIKHTGEAHIYNDYEEQRDWYAKSKKNEYFWPRYREWLIAKSGIDINSINLLDVQTLPNIMNCLGNPKEVFEGKRLRRGLIIGDVQSGKTATYTGLICKAADAGYKVVILLAGITENLRQQTQQRIDEGIVGTSIIKRGKQEVPIEVGVGPNKASSFTSVTKDFVSQHDNIIVRLNQQSSLVLFIVKKNVSVLNRLYNWLNKHNADPNLGYVDIPMLLIDDEADNASVNTKKDGTDPTKTNKIIRKICNLFKNSTYVGFTATPFANVFIDPDSEDAMKNADLFPEHFIYALPTPSSYIGAKRLFDEKGDHYKNLRFISDIEEPDYSSDEFQETDKKNPGELNKGEFYYKHNKEWHGSMPKSFHDAILCFFIANVVRDVRGQQLTPRSMLINMSRFVQVQAYIKEQVEKIYCDFISTVKYDFKDNEDDNKVLPLYNELKTLWNIHFKTVDTVSFSQVANKDNLIHALEQIKIVMVNGSKDSQSLNFKEEKSLRVIAIGGLALSRGLTLEGLLVSYFYRNTATFDVLMQMGRWFGYRPGYDDLFQVWISAMSAGWYEEIARSTEELKADIRKMCDNRLTPKDFGLKVRYYSNELQITAANKMGTSYDLQKRYTFAGDIYDTPYISINTEHNKTNRKAVADFVFNMTQANRVLKSADVKKCSQTEIKNPNYGSSRYYEDVELDDVKSLLSSIKCSPFNKNFDINNILKYIEDADQESIKKWDVVFEGGESSQKYDIPELATISCIKRAIYDSNKNAIQISSRRRLLGTREGKMTLAEDQIKRAEEACRQDWINNGESPETAKNKDIPIKAYFQYLRDRKPVLFVMFVEPNKAITDGTKEESSTLKKFRTELKDDKIVAFAIGFPGSDQVSEIQKFRTNKVYYQNNIENTDETEDDE